MKYEFCKRPQKIFTNSVHVPFCPKVYSFLCLHLQKPLKKSEQFKIMPYCFFFVRCNQEVLAVSFIIRSPFNLQLRPSSLFYNLATCKGGGLDLDDGDCHCFFWVMVKRLRLRNYAQSYHQSDQFFSVIGDRCFFLNLAMSWKIFSLPHAGLPHTTANTDGELLLTAEQRIASCVLYHTNDASLFTGG